MSFGIEIEFQLRNGDSSKEIAKEIRKLKLSDCEEVRTYNNIEDISGWKIIKEKTCDYEIISPILSDTKECWNEINLICCVLLKHGAYTDDNCAFHVHIGTKKLVVDEKQWILLTDMYRKFEPITCLLSRGEFENISKKRLENFAVTMAMADKLWAKGWSIEKCKEEIKKWKFRSNTQFLQYKERGYELELHG